MSDLVEKLRVLPFNRAECDELMYAARDELRAQAHRIAKLEARAIEDATILADYVRQLDAKARHIDKLEAALEWYAEMVKGCRKITREGEATRHALDHDGGKRAREALGRGE
jgi:hypothetical protein